MKIKSILLFIAVLIPSLCNIHGMEPERPKKVSWKKKMKNALLGKSSASFNLGELPQEIQHEIILLIGQYNGAKSLKEAGQMIYALSQVNKSLNVLINEPKFCFELIRVLAQKFKSSDEYAVQAIGTREAQRQYRFQQQLYSLVCDKNWNKSKVQIQELCAKGADINFIYKSGRTLLMHAAKELNRALFDFLVKLGADINFANYKGITALMIATESASSYDLHLDFEKLIVAHKNFNINQQDIKGNTALMYALMVMPVDKEVVKILVKAGAYPELANFKGLSPLALAKKSDMNSIVNIFEQAIPKK